MLNLSTQDIQIVVQNAGFLEILDCILLGWWLEYAWVTQITKSFSTTLDDG